MHDEFLWPLKQALCESANPERAIQEKRYLKSADVFRGVSVPSEQRIARQFRRDHPSLPFSTVREVAAALWDSEFHDEKRLAVRLIYFYCPSLTPDDWPMLAGWLRQAGSWDIIDEIAAHLLGSLSERWPALEADFDRWVTDDDLWVRRAALVSHVVRIRRGTVATARVRHLCDLLMTDREYFVRKALGWVLRECAVQDPDGTLAFLQPWVGRAPRMILREAVRKLSPEQQQRILAL